MYPLQLEVGFDKIESNVSNYIFILNWQRDREQLKLTSSKHCMSNWVWGKDEKRCDCNHKNSSTIEHSCWKLSFLFFFRIITCTCVKIAILRCSFPWRRSKEEGLHLEKHSPLSCFAYLKQISILTSYLGNQMLQVSKYMIKSGLKGKAWHATIMFPPSYRTSVVKYLNTFLLT